MYGHLPFLMSEDITTNLLFPALNQIDISKHPFFLVACSEFSCHDGEQMIHRDNKRCLPVMRALLCRPAKEINWSTNLIGGVINTEIKINNGRNTHPSFASSQMKFFKSVSSFINTSPGFQGRLKLTRESMSCPVKTRAQVINEPSKFHSQFLPIGEANSVRAFRGISHESSEQSNGLERDLGI